MRLALFDLDHTLLSGDSDVLWCAFLVEHGQADAGLLARSAEMAARYAAGAAAPAEFCGFYVALLAGRSLADWQPWRELFHAECVRPRIPAAARALVQRHRDAGDTLVLSTATNRVISELAAAELGIEHLLATEVELQGGCCTGRLRSTPNMRDGKLESLRHWLQAQGSSMQVLDQASFYSDSINDLPLLAAVGRPVAVDPDAQLQAAAEQRGWPVLRLARDE